MMTIHNYGEVFHVLIPYHKNKRFKEHLADTKVIPGREYDDSAKAWIIPASSAIYVQELAAKHGVRITDPFAPGVNLNDIPEMPDLDVEIPGLKATLRPYQGQGVARAVKLQQVIIGDDPGLGKTIQAIGAVLLANKFPCLVICPAALKINWLREWQKFSDRKAMILDDKTRTSWPQYYNGGIDVFIVNFESLKKYVVTSWPADFKKSTTKDIGIIEFIDKKVQTVIVDEIHKCKDPNSQQTKITARCVYKKPMIIFLSGTLIVNGPKDAYAPLAMLGKLQHFADGTYSQAGFNRAYLADGKPSNTKELKYLLYKHCYFRREKKDVAKDLPEKSRYKTICSISNREEYDHAYENFTSWLKATGQSQGQIDNKLKAQAIMQMMGLKQISERGKIADICDFLEEYRKTKQKVVLFCTLRNTVKEFKVKYPDAVTITGDDNGEQKQRSVDRFQNDPAVWLVICNVKAAGVGLTLTSSSTVVFAGFPWTFADCLQCEDRTHRIGQVNAVSVHYFLAERTIDEDMYENIQEKKDVSNAVTGGTDEMHMSIVDRAFNLFNLKKFQSDEQPTNRELQEAGPAGDSDQAKTNGLFFNEG